jgi:uncharacterized protein YbcC (UPF0753/DUF2309 family)
MFAPSSMLSHETPPAPNAAISQADLSAALDAALKRIPPLWPLRHFVAVNPFVGLMDRPFHAACELLERVVGTAPLQSPAEYRQAYELGQIEQADLEEACDGEWTPDQLVQALDAAMAGEAPPPLASVADRLDQLSPRAHWSGFVIGEISKWCAVTFDQNQTTWTSPWKARGLYTAWREAAVHDLNPEAFGLVGFRSFVASLPNDAIPAIRRCLHILKPPSEGLADVLHCQLATIGGWAGYVQYFVREDALRGRTNTALSELLAIRMAYDAALHQAFARDGGLRLDWSSTPLPRTDDQRLAALARWQFAYEAGYQRKLARALAKESGVTPTSRPTAQAVFCIDVRSEVFRRHLEEALPGVQTIGFAGFFGFPVSHKSAGNPIPVPQCPALLLPSFDTGEDLSDDQIASAAAERAEAGAWKAFQNSAVSCFSFVETAGLGFAAAFASSVKSKRLSCARAMPQFLSAPIETRAALAAGALRNMGLIRNFSRMVLICGHGSQSANNPYASGLDCGACGGNAGDVNARLAAATLNDPAVRSHLSQQGLNIPPDTFFLAGLHNTTTDDVLLFDFHTLPPTHLVDLVNLRRALALAGAASRRERAPLLGLADLPTDRLDAAVRQRAIDISQVRPEWGLANNAAIIAAPRRRTSGLKLEGRVFLHDYDTAADPDGKILTLILTAPVVVASWISLQYYACRVDPKQYGSGNKVLHNVVGGFGVIEGNGGDLKVGLPQQSIHDGERFVHEPRRLAVYLEAAPSKIAAVLESQPSVRQIFDYGWLHLFALQDSDCFRYRKGTWARIG